MSTKTTKNKKTKTTTITSKPKRGTPKNNNNGNNGDDDNNDHDDITKNNSDVEGYICRLFLPPDRRIKNTKTAFPAPRFSPNCLTNAARKIQAVQHEVDAGLDKFRFAAPNGVGPGIPKG